MDVIREEEKLRRRQAQLRHFFPGSNFVCIATCTTSFSRTLPEIAAQLLIRICCLLTACLFDQK